MYYNFWQDENHTQGIWRKTTLESYKLKDPVWETVLDLDALEPPLVGKTWVWHGSTLLDEGYENQKNDRALIKLSPGGSDADTFREFDLITQKFVDTTSDSLDGGEDQGFELLDPSKCSVSYRSRNELLIGTDFESISDGEVKDSLTDSGCKLLFAIAIAIAIAIAYQKSINVSCSIITHPSSLHFTLLTHTLFLFSRTHPSIHPHIYLLSRTRSTNCIQLETWYTLKGCNNCF
jgi:prolyl oligopeptidase PreP (S9A serine peptidase family)